MTTFGHLRRLSCCFFLGLSSAYGFAQTTAASSTPQPTVADIAREAAKNKRPHGTVVITNDSAAVPRGPFPGVFSGGFDNKDDILKAIDDYRRLHTLKQTETALHEWYDQQDALLSSAIEDNRQIEQRQIDREYGDTGYSNPRDYRQAEKLRMLELNSMRDEQKRKKENSLLSARVQQTFLWVRNGSKKYGMELGWFKIRCGNGN